MSGPSLPSPSFRVSVKDRILVCKTKDNSASLSGLGMEVPLVK